MPAALVLAIQILEALPALITASEEVVQLVRSAAAALEAAGEGRDPTDEEWAALHAQQAALLEKLTKENG